jgi:heme/copper-type cytochrome/quinol oxidase subunit 2
VAGARNGAAPVSAFLAAGASRPSVRRRGLRPAAAAQRLSVVVAIATVVVVVAIVVVVVVAIVVIVIAGAASYQTASAPRWRRRPRLRALLFLGDS